MKTKVEGVIDKSRVFIPKEYRSRLGIATDGGFRSYRPDFMEFEVNERN